MPWSFNFYSTGTLLENRLQTHIRIERILVATYLMLPAAAADCVEKRLWMHSGRKEWWECAVLLSDSL